MKFLSTLSITQDERHHAIGGAMLAALAMTLPPALGAAMLVLGLGIAREWDQHPGTLPWEWSLHVWREALAWGFGALVAVGLYSGLRAAGVL